MKFYSEAEGTGKEKNQFRVVQNSTKAAVRRCFSKQVFLKISQYSQENICVRVFFNTVADLKTCNIIEKRLQHRYFPVNIAKFLRIAFL